MPYVAGSPRGDGRYAGRTFRSGGAGAGVRLLSAASILLLAYAALRTYLLFAGIGSTRRHHVESAWFAFACTAWLAAWAGAGAGPEGPAYVPPTRGAGAGRSVSAEEPGPSPPEPPKRAILALPLLAFATYWWSLGLGFLSDDFVLIARSAAGGAWSMQGAEFFRPLPLSIWGALAASAGPDPRWPHLLNVLLHGVNGWLVFYLGRQLRLPPNLALVAAVVFILFPGSLEAVAWPSGIQDVLMAFGVLSFVVAGAGAANRRAAAPLAITGLIAALLSKETAVVAPALAALLWFGTGRLKNRRVRRTLMASVAVCLGYVVFRAAVAPPDSSLLVAPTRYLSKELISRLFGALAAPWSEEYLHRAPALAMLPVAIGILVVAAREGWSRRPTELWTASRLILAAVVAVVPAYSLFFISPTLQGSRYLYLPSAFWSLFLGVVIEAASTPRPYAARAIGVGAPATLLSAALVGLLLHRSAWIEAASLRDRALDAAETALGTHTCSTVAFVGVPDSVRGAYVFRNGFAEALRLTTAAEAAARVEDARTADCTLHWTGDRFAVARR